MSPGFLLNRPRSLKLSLSTHSVNSSSYFSISCSDLKWDHSNHWSVVQDAPEWTNTLKSKRSVGNGKHVPNHRVNASHYEVTQMLPSAFLVLYYFSGTLLFFFKTSSWVKTLCSHSTRAIYYTHLSLAFSIYVDKTCREGYFDLLEMGFSRR